jgi:hypothetical protein
MLIIVLICFLGQPVFGQNLFQVKLNNCNTASFCLDCGDVKGGFDENLFQEMLDKVESKIDLEGASGLINFQVLIDSKGRGCVLSHSDDANTYITKVLIKHMNKFKAWTPASDEDGEIYPKVSINLYVKISDNNLTGAVERVDMDRFEKSFKGE